MNEKQPSPSEPEVSPELQKAFERVRIARAEKIQRSRSSQRSYRQPYKDANDTDA